MGPQGRPDYSACATVLRYTVDGAAPMYYYRRVAVFIAYSYYILGVADRHIKYREGVPFRLSSLPLATFGVATLNSAALPPLG